jgi:hypothetical protein
LTHWEKSLDRWMKAALIDASTAERIRSYEREQEGSQGLRWPVLLALAFGAVMLAAGVLLFVAAHWENLSPAERFTLVLLMVAIFHLAGAAISEKFHGMAIALHGIGTAALGAGIFLTGQIFNLDEHWPSGVLLWAAGGGLAWWLLRDWVQATLFALLAPAWLCSEWEVMTERFYENAAFRILSSGLLLLAIVYFTGLTNERKSPLRIALAWVGGIGLIPATFALSDAGDWGYRNHPLPLSLYVLGWTVAMLAPLATAFLLRRKQAWMQCAAALWVAVLASVPAAPSDHGFLLYAWHELGAYLLCALGAAGLVLWGLHEKRRERINMGVAGFALTILFFYFSEVMDKLGRSASLMGAGILFLLVGWFMEKTRRKLIAKVRAATA